MRYSVKHRYGLGWCNPALTLILIVSLGSVSAALHSDPLATIEAANQLVPERAEFNGRIQAVNQATVSAETQGRVEDIRVDIGDAVTAGTVLLTMTSTEQRAGLTQAEANLADANSNLATDSAEYRRINDLFQKKFVSKTEMDRATSRLSASKARVNSAEAALRSARQQLSYTEIKAPYSGIVSNRYIEVGEAVRPGTLLLSGYNPSFFRVEVDVPQTIAEKIRVKQLAEIHTIANNTQGPSRAIKPDALILYPTVDPSTSTVRIRLELPQETPDLYPGQFVKVTFDTGEKARLLIPSSCLVYRSEVPAVYVASGDTLQLRQVRAGSVYGDQIEILAGVALGENIALDPVSAAERMVKAKTPAGE